MPDHAAVEQHVKRALSDVPQSLVPISIELPLVPIYLCRQNTTVRSHYAQPTSCSRCQSCRLLPVVLNGGVSSHDNAATT